MIEIINDKPIKICNSCGTKFTFDSDNVHKDIGRYWVNLLFFGLLNKEYRFVYCPGCGKEIYLK
jgi:predicted RNA-binding Zn-ribbon protein involved in translation (DUF1610 family)